MRTSPRTIAISPVRVELAPASSTPGKNATPTKPANGTRDARLTDSLSIDYRATRNSLNPLDIREQLSRFVSANSELLMHTFPANPLITSFYKLGTGGVRVPSRRASKTQKTDVRATTNNFNHLRTLSHSFPASPLFTICSPKHTGGIPRSRFGALKTRLKPSAASLTKSRKIIEFRRSAHRGGPAFANCAEGRAPFCLHDAREPAIDQSHNEDVSAKKRNAIVSKKHFQRRVHRWAEHQNQAHECE